MNQGIKTVIYPVKDVAKAKAMFSKLLGVEPYADQPYYIGFKIGEQEIGLDPNGHKQGLIGPLAYYDVDDIKQMVQSLVDGGATVVQAVKDVGGGLLIGSVKDADGNMIGFRQQP